MLLLNKKSLCTASIRYNFAHSGNGAIAISTSAETFYGPNAVNDGIISVCVDSNLVDSNSVVCVDPLENQ
jgi:hypothetical protein